MPIEDNLSAAGIPYPVANEILSGLKSGGSTSPGALIALGVAPPAAEELARQINARVGTAHLLTASGFAPMASSEIKSAIAGGSAKPVYQAFNSRLIMPNSRQQATVEAVRFSWNVGTMISPPWDTICPRACYAAWYGTSTAAAAAGDCEATLGNDWTIEGVWIEVNDVKYNLTKNGQRGFVVPDGGHVWTDELDAIKIPANTIIRVGTADALALNQYRPNVAHVPVPLAAIQTASGRGDAGSSGTASRLATLDANVTGSNPTPDGTVAGAPIMIIAKPDPADPRSANARSVLIVGDSRAWGDAHWTMGRGIGTGPLAGTRAAQGTICCALNSDDGGRIPWINLAVPGTRLRDLLAAGSTVIGERGFKRRKAALAEVGFPFTSVIFQMGINTVSNYSATDTVAHANLALAELKSYLGDKKFIGATLPPHSFSSNQSDSQANGYRWTTASAADQLRQAPTGHDAYNAWVVSTLPYADPAKLQRISDTDLGKWRKPSRNPGGLLAAAASVGDATIQTDYRVDEGSRLVIEPGLGTGSFEAVTTTTTTGSAAPYTVGLRNALTKAHASGSVVSASQTIDGIHETTHGITEGMPAFVAAKALIV